MLEAPPAAVTDMKYGYAFTLLGDPIKPRGECEVCCRMAGAQARVSGVDGKSVRARLQAKGGLLQTDIPTLRVSTIGPEKRRELLLC